MNGNQNKNVQPVEEVGGVGSYIVTAILAFAIGFASAWLIYHKKTTGAPTTKVSTATTTAMVDTKTDTKSSDAVTSGETSMTAHVGDSVTAGSASSATLKVVNQPAGTTVAVANVTLTTPSWVVIRETDETGGIGRILGAQLFDVGSNDGTVELLRGTVSGKTYFAAVYTDNGDNAFDPKLDTQAKDIDGNSIMTTFKAN